MLKVLCWLSASSPLRCHPGRPAGPSRDPSLRNHGEAKVVRTRGGMGPGSRWRSAGMTTCVVVACLTAVLITLPARAAEKLRVGKAVAEAFSFVPLDIGIKKGRFANNGIEAESIIFAGDARMQQAMAADSIDLALGSGPGMAFIAKGSPVKAVAAMAGPPLLLTIVVRPDGPKTVAELKGKKVSVSTVGSLTYWLVRETSRQQGWGPEGITVVPMGAPQAQYAALLSGQIDGTVGDLSTAIDLEKEGKVRILTRFGHLVQDFHIHVIFGTNKVIAARPEAVRSFLKGWFETIAFMRANKAETIAIAGEVLGKDADNMSRTYDELMPMFSDDGKFNPKALDVLAKSYVELKVLPTEPDSKMLYTEALLPGT
jgi:NitT/TauT family transport system substrate-binding protein